MRKYIHELILYVIIALLAFYVGLQESSFKIQYNLPYLSSNKIDKVMELIERKYYDSIDIHQLEENAINEIFKTLDPHSIYIEKEKASQAKESINGEFGGVGIEYNEFRDSIIVINTLPNMPADKVGIMAGDRIVKVNDSEVDSLENKSNGIKKIIKGKPGTDVNIVVKRKKVDTLIPFTVKRNIIEISSIKEIDSVTDSLGYIKLLFFGRKSFDQMVTAIDKQKDKINSLVIDLRDNGGGILGVVSNMVDLFLKKDKIIIQVLKKDKIDTLFTSKPLKHNFKNIFILVNKNSASASEIFASAMKENDRAIIIGENTFGKGMIQTEYELSDSSLIRLTTAHYISVKGNHIQKNYKNLSTLEYYSQKHDTLSTWGVAPDIKWQSEFEKNIFWEKFFELEKKGTEKIMQIADKYNWKMTKQQLDEVPFTKIFKKYFSSIPKKETNSSKQILKLFLANYTLDNTDLMEYKLSNERKLLKLINEKK